MKLRSLLVPCALLLVGAAAHADWVEYAHKGAEKMFYDPSSISRNRTQRTVWALDQFAQPIDADKHIESSKFQVKIDCKGKRSAVVYMVFYPDPMGSGKAVGRQRLEQPLAPVVPGSPGDDLLKSVCEQPGE